MKIESKVEVIQSDEVQEAVAEEVRMIADPENAEEILQKATGAVIWKPASCICSFEDLKKMGCRCGANYGK